jgi:hypothetical protein
MIPPNSSQITNLHDPPPAPLAAAKTPKDCLSCRLFSGSCLAAFGSMVVFNAVTKMKTNRNRAAVAVVGAGRREDDNVFLVIFDISQRPYVFRN